MAIEQVLVINTNASGSGGIDISHLASYSIQYSKLWSSDSGRNMKGDMKATLVGVFTKIVVQINPSAYDADEIADIVGVLNSASVYVKYYDIQTQQLRVESFYFSDIEAAILNAVTNKVALKQFSIIGNYRRSF